tara:strand:+ start:1451 stop:2074 length:624 start_codon:yes stop_codon:yes gene_type:complete
VEIGASMLSILGKLTKSQIRLGLFFGTLVGLAIVVGIVSLFPSASDQGYYPEQPIPFSHKLHAGTNKIDCKYCHVGVTRSHHASIPPMNVCMNCHRVVKTDSPHIQKLARAYRDGKPIEWVRIHRLPDHVFFNHRPHISAGVSCETCHGDIKEMDRIYQSKPLTMGWCLNCHRGETTPEQVLENLGKKRGKDGRADVAPVNCSTCHY